MRDVEKEVVTCRRSPNPHRALRRTHKPAAVAELDRHLQPRVEPRPQLAQQLLVGPPGRERDLHLEEHAPHDACSEQRFERCVPLGPQAVAHRRRQVGEGDARAGLRVGRGDSTMWLVWMFQ